MKKGGHGGHVVNRLRRNRQAGIAKNNKPINLLEIDKPGWSTGQAGTTIIVTGIRLN